VPVYEQRLPELCNHPSAYSTPLVSRTERGYRARCPQCGTTGPVRESVVAARRALMKMGSEEAQTYITAFDPSETSWGVRGGLLLGTRGAGRGG